MKRSVPVPPPIFTILILTLFALTLSFRILIRNGVSSSDLETNLYHQAPVFNSTLLRYAAVDLSEAKSKQEIEQLLEGNFDSKGRYRTFASWRRFSIHDVKTSKGVPLLLKSPQFYRYWLNFRMVLHDWAKKRRFQSEIMADIVGSVKDPIDWYNGRRTGSNRKYRSCAVVGNSGILLQKGHGGLIDGHEVVIRLNNARIERFEDKVGSKTNISFINSNILHLCSRKQGCFCHPYGANVPIVMYICQPIHFMDYNMCNATHKSPLIVTDPRFDMLCSRIVKYYSLKRFAEVTGKSLDEWASVHDGSLFHYSSGFQAVMLGVGICEKVSIFGFGKSSSARHHYHTNQKAELHLHDYEAEYDFYHDLVKNPLAIPFISGDFKFPSVLFYQ